MIATKNYQSEVELQMLVVRAFQGIRMKSYRELTEGLCNVAYLIELEDGRKTVLKIAPENEDNLMSYEVNMMQAEVSAMELVHEKTDILLPKVYYYDDSKSLCSSTYFFMECFEGSSLMAAKDTFTEEEISALEYEIGKIIRSLHEIKGEKFGLLGAKESWQEDFFTFFYQVMAGILHDGMRKNVDIGIDYEEVRALLLRDKEVFNEVTNPVLVHWDAWYGNWFVKDKKIEGLIDWERALWGEGLMEDRFRSFSLREDFLRGYGIDSFTRNQKIRMAWYDIYLYLIMMIEGAYREYDDDGQYQWVKKLFLPIMSKVKNNEIE
jgi:aminoglycoside phosphotransferase (APT) family kinase protein